MRIHAFLSSVLVAILALFVGGCASQETINTETAEGAYELAEKYEKDGRYEEAITYFNEVKNKHPYSRLAIESELRVGDIEFKRENYIEAEAAYKLFKEFHPEHAKTDYVTFQTGLSVYNQLPTTIDRDLSLATTAVSYFDEVISSFPQSPYAKKAAESRAQAMKMLAEQQFYIAEYYFKRNIWQSALGRYEDILRTYPQKEYAVKALYGATIAAYNMKELDKSKGYFKRLLGDFPDSNELEKARKELADGF